LNTQLHGGTWTTDIHQRSNMMNTLNTEMAGHGVTAPDLRKLTTAEIEAVSGGWLPAFVAGIVIGAAVVIAASEENPLSAIDFSRLRELAGTS
jgi:lactobin A/cerein 7B family class IIb bacteriocin